MPLALLALGAGIVFVIAAIKNEHPANLLTRPFGGGDLPAPGRSPGEQFVNPPPGQTTTPSEETGGQTGGSSEGTPSVQKIVAFATRLGLTVGGICGGGSVPGSQHPHCNAVDLNAASHAKLLAAFHAMLIAAKTGAIPCSELIGPTSSGVGNGQIATAAGGWRLRPYEGPRDHDTHIHASGSPLM